uniref:Uncharacterized protein n=1 Tax=Cacopsylla melanoneura TaxID=428564 RepID=A0A8D8VV71_9HEMI
MYPEIEKRHDHENVDLQRKSENQQIKPVKLQSENQKIEDVNNRLRNENLPTKLVKLQSENQETEVTKMRNQDISLNQNENQKKNIVHECLLETIESQTNSFGLHLKPLPVNDSQLKDDALSVRTMSIPSIIFNDDNERNDNNNDDTEEKDDGTKELIPPGHRDGLQSRFPSVETNHRHGLSRSPSVETGICHPSSEVYEFAIRASDVKDSSVQPENVLDAQPYTKRKMLVQGMMDVALLTANANQLRTLLEYGRTSGTFHLCVAFIVFSLCIQVRPHNITYSLQPYL